MFKIDRSHYDLFYSTFDLFRFAKYAHFITNMCMCSKTLLWFKLEMIKRNVSKYDKIWHGYDFDVVGKNNRYMTSTLREITYRDWSITPWKMRWNYSSIQIWCVYDKIWQVYDFDVLRHVTATIALHILNVYGTFWTMFRVLLIPCRDPCGDLLLRHDIFKSSWVYIYIYVCINYVI